MTEHFEVSDDELLCRAVRNARSRVWQRVKHPRWVAVTESFTVGSTYAHLLCRRFGLDPDEKVKR